MNDVENDLMLLRGLVVRELETINCYRLMMRECDDSATVEFLQHIIDEEKFHIAHTLRAIARVDADQADLLRTGFAEGHVSGELPSEFGVNEVGGMEPSLNSRAVADNHDPVGPPQLIQAIPTSSERESGQELASQTDLQSTGDSLERRGLSDPAVDAAAASRPDSSWTVGSLRGVPQS